MTDERQPHSSRAPQPDDDGLTLWAMPEIPKNPGEAQPAPQPAAGQRKKQDKSAQKRAKAEQKQAKAAQRQARGAQKAQAKAAPHRAKQPDGQQPDAAAAAAAPAQPRAASSNLEKIRRRKKMRRVRAVCALVLLAAGVLAYITGVFGASLALLGDAADSVSIAFMQGGGWPQEFKLTGFCASQPMAGGFCAVGSSDVTVYSGGGKLLRTLQHSYANPALTANGTRFCLYNRGGTELSVESRTRSLYTYTTPSPIRFCAMSGNSLLCVATHDEIIVLDGTHEEKLRWKPDADVVCAAFSPNNKRLLLAAVQPKDGQIGTVIYGVDITGKQEYADVVLQTQTGLPLSVEYISAQQILVVYDTYAAVYNAQTGETEATYAYGARLLAGYSVNNGNLALLFGSQRFAQAMQAVLLDSSLQPLGSYNLGKYAQAVRMGKTEMYVQCGKEMRVYNAKDGAFLGAQPLTEQPRGILYTDKLLVFGKNSVSVFSMEKQNYVTATA